MDGFKDSTKMKYMGGGMVDGYAKGGDAKVGAKIAKVMGEFKSGKLHSGSKDGAKVSSPKQAMAIALSEAGKSKMPVKKADGGSVKRPSMGESLESAKRMAEMEAKEMREMMLREKGMGAMAERKMRMMREMKKRVPATRREPMLPPMGASVDSARRIAKEEDAEARAMGVFKKGGDVQKKALGGSVMKGAMKDPRMQRMIDQIMQQIAARQGAAPARGPRGAPLTQRTPPARTPPPMQRTPPAQMPPPMQRMPQELEEIGLIDNRIDGGNFGKPMPPRPSSEVRDAAYIEGRDYTIDPRTGKKVPYVPDWARIGPGFGAALGEPLDSAAAHGAGGGILGALTGSQGMPQGAMPSMQAPAQPGGVYGTNMSKSQFRNMTRYGSADPFFGVTSTVNSGSPAPQAPAAMPGAPQTNPRFKMGGLAAMPKRGR